MKNYLFILLLLTLSITSKAQDNLTPQDSLKIKLETASAEDKMEVYKEIIDFYHDKSDSAIKFSEEAMDYAIQTNQTFEMHKVLFKLGDIYHILADYGKSMNCYKTASDYFLANADSAEYGKSLNKIASSLSVQGEYEEAINYCLMSIKILEEIDNKDYLASSYNHLGILYYIVGDYPRAEIEALKGLEFCRENGNIIALSTAHEHLFIIYIKIDVFDKAMYHLNKAYELNKRRGNKIAIAGSLGNLALLFSEKKDYKSAVKYYKESIKLKEELKHKRGLGSSYLGLGLTYYRLKNIDECLAYFMKSYNIRKEIGDKRGVVSTLKRLVKVNRESGRYKAALKFDEELHAYKDSLYSEAKQKEIAKMQQEFEVDRKEKELELLQRENDIERNQNTYLSIFVVILLLFSIYTARLNYAKRELIDTKDKFFSIISHDLRSPFQGLLGIVNVLNNEIDHLSKDEIKSNLGLLKNSSNRIYALLDNLLEWSRLQGKSISYEPVELNLHDQVEVVLNNYSLNANNKKIKVINNTLLNCRVKADEYMFASILRNLISNAIKFSHLEGTIEVSCKKAQKMVEISVKDSGIGIPKEMMPLLFDAGEKNSRTGTEGEKSSGLGLLLCKEYVIKHGGKIWAESKDGEGAVFSFTLPRV